MSCICYNLSKSKSKLIGYNQAWKWQKSLMDLLHSEGDQSPHRLIILEHPSIYTLGRGGSLDHLINKNENTDIIRVERGGEITWHGPGQLVMYPILNLKQQPLRKDLHWLVNNLEQVVIDTLDLSYNIKSQRSEVNNGVWIDNKKISAVGITASRWITMHGISLNMNPDMKSYDSIVPCGITDNNYGVTSIDEVLKERGEHIDWNHQENNDIVIDSFVKSFERNFNLNLYESPHPDIELDVIYDVISKDKDYKEPKHL